MSKDHGEIVIYTAPDGRIQTEMRMDSDTLWLTQRKMAELFDKDSDTIGLHLKTYIQKVNWKCGKLPRISR